MKILVGHAGFYPHSGGGDKYVENVGKALVDKGHEVTVFCVDIPKYKYTYLYKGIKVKRFKPLIKFCAEVDPIVNTFGEDIKNFDVVHLHNIQQLMIQILFLRAKFHKIPVIITVHSDPAKETFFGNVIKTLRWWVQSRYIFKFADKRIVLTEFYRKLFEARGVTEPMDVIPNGIDISQFKYTDIDLSRLNLPRNKKIALFVGRFSKQKGIDYLLKAIPLVKSKDVIFVLAGTGELAKKLRILSERSHIEDRVLFLGKITEDEKVGLYHRADFVIIPSIYEGLPAVLLETMACKKPLIMTKINGIDKLVEKYQCGITVPAKNESALAEAIDRLANHPNLRELGENGYKNVNIYDWKNITKKIENIYIRVIEN